MIFEDEKCWNESDRNNVLQDIKEFLTLYLFKEGVPQLKNSIEHLFNLTPNEVNYLKIVHFILSKEVNDFVDILPTLIPNLSHSTQKELIEYKGIVRGYIDWNVTYKNRFSKCFNDHSTFMCSPVSKSYDLEENQLLKFIIEKIIFMVRELSIRELENNIQGTEYWKDIIRKRFLNVKKASKNLYFNEISSVKIIKPKAIRKTFNHRNKLYLYVFKVYKLYESLFIKEDKKVIIDLIKKQILEPLNNDQLYEIYVFFKLIDGFPNKENLKLGLLKPENDYSAKYSTNEESITIYYQNVPEIFKKESKNKEIFNSYNLDISSRRPDIIIEFEKNGIYSYRIIEVKRTKAKYYIVNSVYKVLAYIYDFKKIETVKNLPSVLVVWNGIKIQSKKAYDNEVIILNKEEFLLNIENIIIA